MSERSRAHRPIVTTRSQEKGEKRHGMKGCLACEVCMKRIAFKDATYHHVKPLHPQWNDVPKGNDEVSNIIVVGALCEQLLHRNKMLLQLLIKRVSQLNLNTYIGEGYIKFMPEFECQYSQRALKRGIEEEKQTWIDAQKEKDKTKFTFARRKK